jgi:hypothetical protein
LGTPKRAGFSFKGDFDRELEVLVLFEDLKGVEVRLLFFIFEE